MSLIAPSLTWEEASRESFLLIVTASELPNLCCNAFKTHLTWVHRPENTPPKRPSLDLVCLAHARPSTHIWNPNTQQDLQKLIANKP